MIFLKNSSEHLTMFLFLNPSIPLVWNFKEFFKAFNVGFKEIFKDCNVDFSKQSSRIQRRNDGFFEILRSFEWFRKLDF